MRYAHRPALSSPLVAEEGDALVGHIAFTPVALDTRPDALIMGLAPMAVMPTRQRHGIGSALVRAGLAECRTLGYGAVVVLGHPDYYPALRLRAGGALRHRLRIQRAG